MKVKICGITSSEDALTCFNAGADALGFVFYENSNRFVHPDKAYSIIKVLPSFIVKTGVFVNATPDVVNKTAKQLRLNTVQLHGDESPEIIEKIDYEVIKSFRVSEQFDYSSLNAYSSCHYLLDTYDPNEYGGTGRRFNWNLIPSDLRDKIILAGGLSVSNIEYVREVIKPSAVDVSSSLESAPGVKDRFKVIEFLSIAKKDNPC